MFSSLSKAQDSHQGYGKNTIYFLNATFSCQQSTRLYLCHTCLFFSTSPRHVHVLYHIKFILSQYTAYRGWSINISATNKWLYGYHSKPFKNTIFIKTIQKILYLSKLPYLNPPLPPFPLLWEEQMTTCLSGYLKHRSTQLQFVWLFDKPGPWELYFCWSSHRTI